MNPIVRPLAAPYCEWSSSKDLFSQYLDIETTRILDSNNINTDSIISLPMILNRISQGPNTNSRDSNINNYLEHISVSFVIVSSTESYIKFIEISRLPVVSKRVDVDKMFYVATASISNWYNLMLKICKPGNDSSLRQIFSIIFTLLYNTDLVKVWKLKREKLKDGTLCLYQHNK